MGVLAATGAHRFLDADDQYAKALLP